MPQELTVSQLATIVRNRLSLSQTQSLFLFTSSGQMLQLSMSVEEAHSLNTDQDGFLYVTYSSQEAFGCEVAGRASSGLSAVRAAAGTC